MFNPRVLLNSAIAGAVVLSAAACDKASPTDPLAAGSQISQAVLGSIPLATTYNPTAVTPGQVILCKDASSPAGTYTFNISATKTQAGDQVASAATLAPGQCTIVFNRATSQDTTYALV